jgi:DNA gyrase subunit B
LTRKSNKDDYKITALEGRAAVRKIPGMYIGNTDDGTGYHHMLMEVLDNSVDEYLANRCDKVTVTLHLDGSASVGDNGRGIPTYHMQEKNMSALEVVFCTLHAGGKFDKSNYEISGGLHGVGISVVNALSGRLKVVVRRDSHEYTMVFERGKKIQDLSKRKVRGKSSGTFIRFGPDLDIFKGIVGFDSSLVECKLKELSYLCRGLEIEFIDENNNTRRVFDGSNNISGFVGHLATCDLLSKPIEFSGSKAGILVDVGMQWLEDGSETSISRYFTNNIPNPDGGSHTSGFRTSLTRTINSYITNSELPKSMKINVSGDDIREGLVSIVSIRHPNPKFSSQTKEKLVSDDARTAVESITSKSLTEYLEQNPVVAKRIVSRCVNALKAREAAKKAREAVRKSVLKDGGVLLPGKLADCSSRNPDECELFIVEGSSASGCFSKDTLIQLIDGSSISFGNLINGYKKGEEYYCYSVEKNGRVGIHKIENPKITKKNVGVIEVVLSNRCKIVCTPDHLLMKFDGSFVRADESLNVKLKFLDASIEHEYLKAVDIVKLDKKIDVCDLEVPGNHNFALSAGIFVHNSAKQGRDRKFQAILPLRGKVLNIEKCEFGKMMANEELVNLIAAIGVGIGRSFNFDDIRYKKVIIMADSDVDGSHIRTLLLTFFFRQMPELIYNGCIYIAQPPLYRVNLRGSSYYLKDDKARDDFVRERNINRGSLKIQRFKGLGEMNPSQLWDTSMNPDTRSMIRVVIGDYVKADRMFSILMGGQVEPRKAFIINNSHFAKNLDI